VWDSGNGGSGVFEARYGFSKVSSVSMVISCVFDSTTCTILLYLLCNVRSSLSSVSTEGNFPSYFGTRNLMPNVPQERKL
jgi:hypothetical protein